MGISESDPRLSFDLSAEDTKTLTNFLDESGIYYSIRDHDRFSGADALSVVVPLTATIVSALTAAYTRYEASKRHVSVKYEGLEVKGISEATLLKILELHKRKRPKG